MCAAEIKMFFISFQFHETHKIHLSTTKGLLFFAPTPALPLIRPNCCSGVQSKNVYPKVCLCYTSSAQVFLYGLVVVYNIGQLLSPTRYRLLFTLNKVGTFRKKIN